MEAHSKNTFNLLFDEVKHQLLCTGGNLGFTFLHDIHKLQIGEFYLFGLLCCAGVLKGCAAPRCFLSEHFAHASKEFSVSQGMTSTEIIKLFQAVI